MNKFKSFTNKCLYDEWKNEGRKDNPKKFKKFYKYLFLIILNIFCLYCIFSLNWKRTTYGNESLKKALSYLFQFDKNSPDFIDQNYWLVCLKSLFSTIQYTALGSLLGFFFAYFTAFLASRNLHKSKAHVIVIKLFILILRSVPEFFFINLFKSGFDKLLLATLVLTWFTWLWVHKYLVDIFEQADTKYYENSILLGNKKIKAFMKDVSKRNENKIIMLFILSFEANLRWTTLLSSAGLVGLGNFIITNSVYSNYKTVGIPIVLLLLVLVFLELLSILINKLVFKPKQVEKNNKLKWVFNRSKIYLWALFIVFFGIAISVFFKIDYKAFNNELLSHTFKEMTQPNYAVLKQKSWEIFKSFWIMIKLIFASIYVAFFISIFIAFIGNNKINSPVGSIVVKIILVILRTIPAVLIYELAVIVHFPEATLFIVLVISLTRSLSKFYIEAVNNISSIKIQNLKARKLNRFIIFYKFIYKEVKSEFSNYLYFRFESAFRKLISFGAISAIGLGGIMYQFMNNDMNNEVAAITLLIMIVVIMIELVSYFIAYLQTKKENQWRKFKL